MKNCPNLQKSLDWCEGMPQLPGIRRRLYYTNKNLIVAWPELDRDDFGRVVDANYIGAFELAEGAYWQYIDVNIDKSTVTSEPQGEVPSQTQLNKATFVHNGIDDEATAAAGFLNNSDCVIVYEDMRGHFRVLGNNKWRTLITVSQDQGQGTNPASTTINVEVTDVIAPPFYAEGLETEDGEVFPHANSEENPTLEPTLTRPRSSETTFDIGTMSESGTTISKQMYIKGENLNEPLTLTKSGTGLTISKTTITAEEANAGINVTLTYTKSTSGAGSLNGSLRIRSSEGIDRTITVTARKAALTSPSASTFDVGTIAADGNSVQKTMFVQGVNLSQVVSIRTTGTGFSCNKTSITAAAANDGINITITYSNSASGAASAEGTIRLYSSEVDKTIDLTAAKAAAAATPTLTQPTANSLDVGTIASDGSSVYKNLTIRAENINQPLSIAVSGTGFSISTNSLTVQQALAGTTITVTYTNSASGAASATGELRITSSEGIDKTISLTAAKEAPAAQPTLTSPTISSLNVGTIASDGTSVSKSITVRGENITQPVTLTVSGTGFSVNKSSLTAAQVLAGYGVQVTYTNSETGDGSTKTGSLVISSSEDIRKEIALTASKAAPSVNPAASELDVETPESVIGFVMDYASKVNGFMSEADVTDYPSQSKRQTIAMPVSSKFPAVPADQRHYQDTSTDSANSPEENFIINTVFEDYTPVEAINVKAFLLRMLNTDIATRCSPFLLNPQKSGTAYRETSNIPSGWLEPQTMLFNCANLQNYATTNKYYLIANFKKKIGSSDNQIMSQAMRFRENFDVMIFPQTWNIKDIFLRNYQSYFSGLQGYAAGMVMDDEVIIQLFTQGRIVVLDRSTKEVIATGTMANAGSTIHCNAVSMVKRINSLQTERLLYISEWTSVAQGGSPRCHVQRIGWDSHGILMCTALQTITYTGSKFKSGTQFSNWDWSVDVKTGDLYCYGYATTATDRYGDKICLKFNRPAVPTGTVTSAESRSLSDSDILDEFTFNFAGAQQDVHIENGWMFYEFSYNNSAGTGGVLMIDLGAHTVYSDYIIDLASTGREPEGICRDGSTLFITSHQGGNNNFNLQLHQIDLLQTNLDEE